MYRVLIAIFIAGLVFSCSRTEPPIIESMSAEPDSVYPRDTVVLTHIGNRGDEKDSWLHFEWSCPDGEIYDPNDPTGYIRHWIAPDLPGDYYLTLTLTDPEYSIKDSIKVVVLDTAGSIIDSRDGKEYKWMKIGSQIWMAGNLAYLPEVSPSIEGSDDEPYYYVYDYEGSSVLAAQGTENYDTYGVLYNWEAAKIACPPNWHLPSDEEWIVLEKYLGMSNEDAYTTYTRMSGEVGGKLKSQSGWIENGNGNNSSGFNAQPAGYRYFKDGKYLYLGIKTYFWTSTEYDSTYVWERDLSKNDDGVYRFAYAPSYGFSVRCIQDE